MNEDFEKPGDMELVETVGDRSYLIRVRPKMTHLYSRFRGGHLDSEGQAYGEGHREKAIVWIMATIAHLEGNP